MAIEILPAIPEGHRTEAARLFWEAFSAKLTRLLGLPETAIRFITRVLDPNHGIAAVDGDRLLGIAGYKTDKGALVGGELSDLSAIYGPFGGLWRGLPLALLERPTAPDTLLMDGIAVTEAARGQGIGARLLDAIKDRAAALHKSQIRLDVIDKNPRARALYERQGFVAGETQSLGPFAVLFGFRHATTMTFTLGPKGP